MPPQSELDALNHGVGEPASPCKRVKPFFEGRSSLLNPFESPGRSLCRNYELPDWLRRGESKDLPDVARIRPGDTPISLSFLDAARRALSLSAFPTPEDGEKAGFSDVGGGSLGRGATLSRDHRQDVVVDNEPAGDAEEEAEIALAALRGISSGKEVNTGSLVDAQVGSNFPSISNSFLGGTQKLVSTSALDMSHSLSGSGRSSRGSDLVGASTDNAMDPFAFEEAAANGIGGVSGDSRGPTGRNGGGERVDDIVARDYPSLNRSRGISVLHSLPGVDVERSWSVLVPNKLEGNSRSIVPDLGRPG